MRGLLVPNALLFAVSRRRYTGGGLDLAGVFVPVPTPYQRNGDVDYGALAANFQRWERIPFKGIVFWAAVVTVIGGFVFG